MNIKAQEADVSELPDHSKRDAKKRALARHTLDTLAKWGYARTSLRAIADEAGIALGTIHYYFKDKIELICYCAQIYKIEFASAMTEPLVVDAPGSVLIDQFADVLTTALQDDPKSHTLWFDIRTQAMFDKRFEETVREIDASLTGACEILVTRLGIERFDAIGMYSVMDGMFRHYLQQRLMGDERAGESFRRDLTSFLRSVMESDAV